MTGKAERNRIYADPQGTPDPGGEGESLSAAGKTHKPPDIWTPALSLYAFIVIGCVAFLVYVALMEGNSITSARIPSAFRQITDYEYERVEDPDAPTGYYDHYTLQIKNGIRGEAYLVFHMIHSFGEVRVGGSLVFMEKQSRFNRIGRTIGNGWGIVRLYESDLGKDIDIFVEPVYEGIDPDYIRFMMGDMSEIRQYELARALPSALLCLIAVATGIAYMIYSRVSVHNTLSSRTEFRCLGFFSFLLGTWRFSDMQASTLFLPSASIALSYLTLLCLLLMPVPMLMFIWSRLQLDRRWFSFLCIWFEGLEAAVLLLQITNVRDLRQNLTLITLSLLAAMCIVGIACVQAYRHDHSMLKRNMNLLFLVVVFAGVAVDLWMYYIALSNLSMVFTLLSLDIYVIGTGIYYYRILRREAMVDGATGVYNKNTCRLRFDSPKPAPEGAMVVMCDLNGLKETNDRKGHEAGDLLIRSFAEAMANTFDGKNDFVGRYGGDEFVAVRTGIYSREEAERMLHLLRESVNRQNRRMPGLNMSYACGYGLQLDWPGESLDYLLRKADERMYLDKRQWHEARGKEVR